MFRIFYQRLWDLVFGTKDEEVHEVILLVSVLYYSCTLLLGRLLRYCVRQLPVRRPVPYLLDLVTTMQVCACSLENGVVRKHYGMVSYLTVLLLLGVWYSATFGQSSGNPCVNWRRYLLGVGGGLGRTLVKMSMQMTAGWAAYQYARLWWSLSLSSEHAMRNNVVNCSSDLAVPVPVGFSIEAFATFTDILIGGCLFSTSLRYERFQPLFKVICGTCLTYFGLHLTGMYVNPANATAQTFGCEGAEPWEHVTVYWLGPLFGITVATVATGRYARQRPSRQSRESELAAESSSATAGASGPAAAARKLDDVASQVAGSVLHSSHTIIRRRLYSEDFD